MKIIKDVSRETVTEYHLHFTRIADPSSGFRFSCDAGGNRLNSNDASNANYAMCLARPEEFRNDGMQIYTRTIKHPAIGICDSCGYEVTLYGGDVSCERCETEYNHFGQRLTSRSQWGEETGETWR